LPYLWMPSVQNCSPLATRLKPSTAKWAADRFKKGRQASNPTSTRALLQQDLRCAEPWRPGIKMRFIEDGMSALGQKRT
jgi:hypothetical protein